MSVTFNRYKRSTVSCIWVRRLTLIYKSHVITIHTQFDLCMAVKKHIHVFQSGTVIVAQYYRLVPFNAASFSFTLYSLFIFLIHRRINSHVTPQPRSKPMTPNMTGTHRGTLLGQGAGSWGWEVLVGSGVVK